MSSTTRRSFFGFIGIPTIAATGVLNPVRADAPKDVVVDEFPQVTEEVARFAERFGKEILPNKARYFDGEYANRFDYSGSGTAFCITCLERISTVVTACVAPDCIPDVGICGRDAWHMIRAHLVDVLQECDGIAALRALQYRDLRARWLFYDGIPFFWTDDLPPENRYYTTCGGKEHCREMENSSIYIVNIASLDNAPRKGHRPNGVILNSDRC